MTLRDKMLAVIQDVNSQVAEREELVELIAIALLTRNNLFILGKPGQAKSLSINLFRQRITGARQFERLLSKQTDEDQLFGRIDLSSLIPCSVPDAVLQAWITHPYLADCVVRIVSLSGAIVLAAAALWGLYLGGSPFLLLAALGLLQCTLKQMGLANAYKSG